MSCTKFYVSLTSILFTIFLSQSVYAQDKIQLTTSEWEPYLGAGLPNQGYVAELIKRVYEVVDRDVELIFLPLARAKRKAREGVVDGFAPIEHAFKEDKKFLFSDPYPGDYVGLLRRKNENTHAVKALASPLQTLQALKGANFGVLLGSYSAYSLDASLNLSKVVKHTQLLDLLFRDRIDYAIIDKYTAADLMVTKQPHLIGAFEFISPPLWQNDFRVAFSKKRPSAQKNRADFNLGLKLLQRQGEVEKIASKHGLFFLPKYKKGKTRLRIATVNNNDMLIMQKQAKEFERIHPDIELQWRMLDENVLRKRTLSDLAIDGGAFDVVTIGSFEAPLWAKKGWLMPIESANDYNHQDLLKPIKDSLSYEGRLYALPFYGESSMTYYRKDLFEKAGLIMPNEPTYQQILAFAKKLHDPDREVNGICLRGQAGWGANMAFFNTLVNSFGGAWFDQHWQATIDSAPWKQALTLYKTLASEYGPEDMTHNNFNENLELFAQGHCAMWIDATVAASTLFDSRFSQVHQQVGFAQAPIGVTKKGSHWLWAWSLAIPVSSKVAPAALKFISWATSEQYIEQVAEKEGPLAVPPGTRLSTYQNMKYQQQAPFSQFVLKAIRQANPVDNTLPYSPYNGIQFVGIAEYPALGDKVGLLVQQVIKGELEVEDALKQAQDLATEQMIRSGYLQNNK